MKRAVIDIQQLMLRLLAVMLIVVVSLGTTEAQTSDWIKANEAFEAGYYNDALDFYKKALRKNKTNTELMYKAAESAKHCNDYKQAIKYYKLLGQTTGGYAAYPDALYYLATMYRSDNKPDSAIVVFDAYLEQGKYKALEFEKRALQERQSCYWVLDQRKDTTSKPYYYAIDHLSKQINTKMNESAAIKIGSAILFARTTHVTKSESKNAVFSEFILTQIYQTNYLKNGKLSKAILNEWGLNDTRMHSGNIAYDDSTKTIYFTLCDANYNGEGNMCGIYMTEYRDKKWTTPSKIASDVNIEGYTSTHPTIGHTDGKTLLYFSSDRPGGSGGMDIWYVVLDSNNIGKSVNLGGPINTPGNEITPYYSDQTKSIFFASDWHYGYGGYDIFESAGGRDQWKMPINLGEPINTSANDLYFSLSYPDTTTGFLTSNREGSFFTPGNTCCNDIYKWNIVIDSTCPCLKRKKDTIMAVPIDLSLQQQARMLIPISLFFHNDEPDPRSLSKTTLLTYEDTYKSYIGKRDEYLNIHTKAGDVEEAARLEAFFVDSVENNYNRLKSFLSLLRKDLLKGCKVKLLIKGFASPLHTSEYNYILSQRRISSFVNQLQQMDTSLVMLKGVEDGNLIVEEVPFGSSKADNRVSSNAKDVRRSVYGLDAALERKIEILDYQYFDTTSVLMADKPLDFFIGDIKKGTIDEIILGFIIAGNEAEEVDCHLDDIDNVKAVIYPERVPGCNLALSFIIDTHKLDVANGYPIPIELRIKGEEFAIKCRLIYNIID